MAACRSIVRDGCAHADPWCGLSDVVHRLNRLNAENQGFVDAFMADHPDAVDLPSHREEMLRALAGLARRAVTAGDLRPDFVLDDLVLVILAGRSLSVLPAPQRPAAADRLSALAMESFRASGERSALPAPPRIAGRASLASTRRG